jgi:predicted MFS family arabinose efflux permease
MRNINHTSVSGTPPVTSKEAYYALFVLWLVHAIANIDRFAFGIVVQKIKVELVLTDAQVGMATGLAFVVAYVGFGIPVSHWVGRVNRRNLLAGAVGVWSLMTVACGAAGNIAQLTLARIGLGAAESPCVPASVSLIASYFDREKRSQAAGIFNSAAAAAGIVGTPLMGYIADHYGWRAGFYVFGAIGLFLGLVVRITLREPVRAELSSFKGRVPDGKMQSSLIDAVHFIYTNRGFRYLLLSHALYGIGFFAFATWLPVMLIRSYGFTYTDLGLYSGVVIGLTMLVASIGSGFVSPIIVRRAGNDRAMVYIPAVFCLLSIPFMLVGSMGVSKEVVMVCGVAVFFCALIRTPPLLSLTMDLLPPAMHGTGTMALVIFSSILGSALGPVIVGMVSDNLTPTLGSGLALQQALLWVAPAFCIVGSLLAFVPARYVPRQIADVH